LAAPWPAGGCLARAQPFLQPLLLPGLLQIALRAEGSVLQAREMHRAQGQQLISLSKAEIS